MLVCGLGHFGFRAAELLLKLGVPITVLTKDAREEWRRAVEGCGASVLLGDARDERILEQAGIARVRAVLALTDSDLANIEIALDARRLRKDVPVVVRLFDQTLARQLEQGFDIRRAVGVSTLAAPAFAGAALGERTLGSLELAGTRFVIAKHTVDPASPAAGTLLREMAWRHRLQVVARRRVAHEEVELPDPDETVAPGDQLFLLAEKSDWLRLAQLAGRPEPHHARRAPEVLALASRVWRGTSPALRGVFLGLLALILMSVAVFSVALRLSPIDSLYFVVSTVTTTGYGDISAVRASPLVKLYAVFVMLLGSLALAVVTSMVTGYVVAERFRGLLGRRRVPREDHVVVVGIGALGFRTLEELSREGVPSVAVDRDGGGELLQGVRRVASVVVGDGRSEAVLSEAGVRSARAVVAVTDDDAANLGIALTARKLNPRIRAVVRLFDGEFARKVESALDVDVAIGAAHVAAPLFAASALAPGVRTAFVAGTSLVAVVEETVNEELAGLTPERIRAEKGLHVLRVRGETGWREPARGEPLAEGTVLLASRIWSAGPQ